MPQIFKPATYQFKIERELERLRISKTSILLVDRGKDKFSLTDGNRSVTGRGSAIMRVLKKMPVGAGYSKFFEAFKDAEGIVATSTRRIVISSH
jgi:hypothetical protein